jgi:hypothetical protein
LWSQLGAWAELHFHRGANWPSEKTITDMIPDTVTFSIQLVEKLYHLASYAYLCT